MALYSREPRKAADLIVRFPESLPSECRNLLLLLKYGHFAGNEWLVCGKKR